MRIPENPARPAPQTRRCMKREQNTSRLLFSVQHGHWKPTAMAFRITWLYMGPMVANQEAPYQWTDDGFSIPTSVETVKAWKGDSVHRTWLFLQGNHSKIIPKCRNRKGRCTVRWRVQRTWTGNYKSISNPAKPGVVTWRVNLTSAAVRFGRGSHEADSGLRQEKNVWPKTKMKVEVVRVELVWGEDGSRRANSRQTRAQRKQASRPAGWSYRADGTKN